MFSFAVDRLVKSCGKHHQLSRAYFIYRCMDCSEVLILGLAVRREGAGMAFGSVWQACLSSRKLSPPPPSAFMHITI